MKIWRSYIDSIPVISTHEHLKSFPPNDRMTLEFLFTDGYAGLAGAPFDKPDKRERFLELVSGKCCFVWYEKALDELFSFGGTITAKNWDSISERIGDAMARKGFHEEVFHSKCNFTRAIVDPFWDSGSNHGRPDLYAPALRIDPFLYGSNLEFRDHAGKNAQLLYGACSDFDQYLAKIDRVIGEFKAKGNCCLKSGMAHLRSLAYRPRDKADAAKVFGKPGNKVSHDEFTLFGDYIFDYCCDLAAKHDMPFQNHTGTAKLAGSNSINLIPMIEKHPQTKFVLFHVGYPWMGETVAISHNYDNVYIDTCWLSYISTSAAEHALHSLIETCRDTARVTWGGDCFHITESFASMLSMRYALAKVLSEKVASRYLTESRAKRFAERILYVNAKELYGI